VPQDYVASAAEHLERVRVFYGKLGHKLQRSVEAEAKRRGHSSLREWRLPRGDMQGTLANTFLGIWNRDRPEVWPAPARLYVVPPGDPLYPHLGSSASDPGRS
jgi:hypothetical protein